LKTAKRSGAYTRTGIRRPVCRWFWSITQHIDPALGIVTNGRVPTLDEAKAQFKSRWSKVREAREQKERQQL
jgi:hypothetical protein